MRNVLLSTGAALAMMAAPMAQAESHAQMEAGVIEEAVVSSADEGVLVPLMLLLVILAVIGTGPGNHYPY
ncbi:hypothetical protein GEU84_005490 [Fertoebacter nigrum]|uniref:Ferrochelatase n=1 Tax=Fertoeibacter niger TaxID=2656921 RepID=A0A8X8GXU6_9RHOB|nr:hypothetical protein [Fertoeibacter niger]NUB43828.1 hypothetical protein [Fertoeibacter niger]